MSRGDGQAPMEGWYPPPSHPSHYCEMWSTVCMIVSSVNVGAESDDDGDDGDDDGDDDDDYATMSNGA